VAFQSGKNGRALSGGTAINITGWTFTETTDALDVTHSGSSGKRTFISGLTGGEGTVEFDFDDAALFTANPPNLNPGQQITLKLELGNSGKFYQFTAQLTRAELRNPVEGKVSGSASFVSSGAITRPA
jgi:hypothetical protein